MTRPGRSTAVIVLFVLLIQAGPAPAWAGHRDPMLPTTTPPIVYIIDYSGKYFTSPEYIEQFKTSPPDLLHVGKAVPISHHWGPTCLYQGENQYTGGPGHTLSRRNIALLTPDVLAQRIETIRQTLERYHAIGIREIVPYISYHTIAGDHEKREGFWAFYDRWDAYARWAGPKPPRDPFDWLAVDRKGKFIPGSCGGYSPKYYAPLHRYRACINHPDWAEWHRRLIRMVAEVGYDGCFVDNASCDDCFCQHCKKRFAEFITRSGEVGWVRRLAKGLRPEQIALGSRDVPAELVRRWRWLRTRDHLGMLRDVGRQAKPGFTIFPNHGRLSSALVVGAKSDRLMFESTFSPGIVAANEPRQTGAVSVAVVDEPVDPEPFVYRYSLRDRALWMEMQAEIAMPSRVQVGKPAPIEVKVVSVGDSSRDGDAAEDLHLVFVESRTGEKVRVPLTPTQPVGGSGSSRKPRRPPATVRASWTPANAGRYEVRFGFTYTDDEHADVTRNRPRLDRLVWGQICRSHLASLLFTQHMHARAIYLGYEARGVGWENVQDLALAEVAAFSGGGGFSGRRGPQAKYRTFFKKHPELFDGWRQTAPAAVLFTSWGSNPIGTGHPCSAPTIHQHLASTGRLFAVLVDTNLPERPDELAGFRAICLESPRYEMTPAQLDALRGYVHGGGWIVLGGRSVTINDMSAPDVFGLATETVERPCGRGKVVLWDAERPTTPTRPVAALEGRSRNLRFALYRKGDRLALHTVNYNVCLLDKRKKVLDVGPTPVEVPLPAGWTSVGARCFDPDGAPELVACSVADGTARLTLPKTHMYKVVLIEKR